MKWHPWIFSSFLLFAGFACAEENAALENIDCRVTKLEKTFRRASNPPALLAPGFFFQADLLFWQARETGLSYAIVASEPVILELLPRNFYVKEPEFEWDFGFRVGLGYGLKSDGWDLFSLWTRFVTDAHDKGSISSDRFFLPIWADPNFTPLPFDQISEAEAHWTLHFNQIDAGVGRGFYFSKFFSIRPFIGPSAVWINQHYHIKYVKPAIAILPARTDHIHLENEFFGIGAAAGCDLSFRLTRAVSLFTRGTAAIYAGRFEVSRKENLESIFGGQKFHVSQVIHAGRPATALEMGLSWEHGIQKKYYVRAELCYDIHYFFKQNQMQRIISKAMSVSPTFLSDQGDLALHGGSFSVLFGF
jgi:Legionella pneumophila major outer membrane protein precursor